MNLYYKLRYLIGHYKKKFKEVSDQNNWDNSSGKDISKSKEILNNLKNKYQNKRCFIIGNGPSINQMDLNLMKDDYVFVSNSFFLKFDDLEFRPQFLTVEDHLVAEDNKFEFENLKNITKFYPLDLKHTLKLDDSAVYVNFPRAYIDSNSSNFPYFSDDALDKIYWGGTVLYMSIQLAAFIGFSEIILIGVDLTYKIPEDIKQKGNVLISQSDDPNHFDSRYFGKGKRWHLPETERMQQTFSKAYHELLKENKKLVNATISGNLQEIPRVDYYSLFGKA